MEDYKIELLLKINNEENTLFNNEKKIIELFNLNDRLITRNFQDEFTLNDIYAYESLLQEQYPENNTIRASIRRNLQKLRDSGKIKFIANGKYQIIE